MSDRIVIRKDGCHYFLGVREVAEAEYREFYPDISARDGRMGELFLSAPKPIHSEALEILPSDVPKAMQLDAKMGVPTEYDKEGQPIFTSSDHQRRYCQAYGYHNNDANWSGKHEGNKSIEETHKEEMAELDKL